MTSLEWVCDDLKVAGRFERPSDAEALYVFAHGAGAGHRHVFMDAIAARLAVRRVATLRWDLPYMARGSRRPDGRAVLEASVRGAIDAAAAAAPDLPLFAGGKSMGGRMTSQALAVEHDERVRGLVLVGFPLHPARKPGTSRAEHLPLVRCPMWFIQGTRDALAELDLLEPIVGGLSDAQLVRITEADHGFAVLKRSGRDPEDVLDEVADAAARACGASGASRN